MVVADLVFAFLNPRLLISLDDCCDDTDTGDDLDLDGDGVTTIGGSCDDQNPDVYQGLLNFV